jgi:hypothetical protein
MAVPLFDVNFLIITCVLIYNHFKLAFHGLFYTIFNPNFLIKK